MPGAREFFPCRLPRRVQHAIKDPGSSRPMGLVAPPPPSLQRSRSDLRLAQLYRPEPPLYPASGGTSLGRRLDLSLFNQPF